MVKLMEGMRRRKTYRNQKSKEKRTTNNKKVDMASKGTVEAEVELKSPAEKFYKIWRSEAHKLPDITSTNIQAVKVHEGDWDSHGAVKIWNYTVGKSLVLD